MKTLTTIGVALAASALVLVWPTAWIVDASSSVEVIPVDGFFEAELAEANLIGYDPEFGIDPDAPPERQLRQREQELASAYGLNPRTATTLVFADASRTLRVTDPATNVDVLLYKWPGSHHPVQRQSIYWLARMLTVGAGAVLVLLLTLGWLLGRRRTEALPVSA